MSRGIIVFGQNGSGKSTVGRELSYVLNYKYMDIEDYNFIESEIPYSKERSRDECRNLMLNDTKKYGSFVLSAVTGDFGDEIVSMYDFGVYITAPIEIRIERVKQRAIKSFGNRVSEGGDMYKANNEFIDFVKRRDLKKPELWLKTLKCPVIFVDGTKAVKENVSLIVQEYLKIFRD